MKRRNSTRVFVMAAVAVLLLVPFFQARSEGGVATSSGSATTGIKGPIRQVENIALRLRRFDDGTDIIVTDIVGKPMTFDYKGLSYGITPAIDDSTHVVRLQIEKLERNSADSIVSVQELETLIVDNKTAKHSARCSLPFSMTLEGTWESWVRHPERSATSKVMKASFGPDGGPGGDNCCVTCDGLRSCACAVIASCGSCCSGDCC